MEQGLGPCPGRKRVLVGVARRFEVCRVVLCQAAGHQAAEEVTHDEATDSAGSFSDSDHAAQADGCCYCCWDVCCGKAVAHLLERVAGCGVVQQQFGNFCCEAAWSRCCSFLSPGQVGEEELGRDGGRCGWDPLQQVCVYGLVCLLGSCCWICEALVGGRISGRQGFGQQRLACAG